MNETGALRIMAYDSPQKNRIEDIALISNNQPYTRRTYRRYLKRYSSLGYYVEVEHVSPEEWA